MTKIWIVLSLSVLLSRYSSSSPLIDCSCSTDNSTINTLLFDEDTLSKLKHQIELLNASNEISRLRLEAITIRLDQQREILNNISEKLNQPLTYDNEHSKKPFIDLRTGILHEFTNQIIPSRTVYPRTCVAATKPRSGIYAIQEPNYSAEPFLVSCDEEAQGGGWTIIQRRVDGTTDFYLDWDSYKTGFGDLEGNFFIGLEKLHALTTSIPQELLIVMTDFDNVTKYAKYDSFVIGHESDMYVLKELGKYSGDAGDSLTFHVGMKFSTKDKDNDNNCAVKFKGAWWYKNCHASNLNGLYLNGTYGKDKYAQGIVWHSWHGHYYSLKTVKMLIRPKRDQK